MFVSKVIVQTGQYGEDCVGFIELIACSPTSNNIGVRSLPFLTDGCSGMLKGMQEHVHRSISLRGDLLSYSLKIWHATIWGRLKALWKYFKVTRC